MTRIRIQHETGDEHLISNAEGVLFESDGELYIAVLDEEKEHYIVFKDYLPARPDIVHIEPLSSYDSTVEAVFQQYYGTFKILRVYPEISKLEIDFQER